MTKATWTTLSLAEVLAGAARAAARVAAWPEWKKELTLKRRLVP
jgi:hypothetical protein